MPDDLKKRAQELLARQSGETFITPDLTRPDFWTSFNQPVTTLRTALNQFGQGKIPTGTTNVLNSILEFAATPFTVLDEGLRSGQQFIESNIVEPLGLTDKDLGIDKTGVKIPSVSEIVGKPFELTAEGVAKGTELIDKGLEDLGLDTEKIDADIIKTLQSVNLMPEGDPNELAKELSATGLKLNQILAQFAVGGELFGTAGRVIKGITKVPSLSPIEGLRARSDIRDIKRSQEAPIIDLEKERLELEKMLESEKPLGQRKTRVEQEKTPIETGKKLSEDKKSILEHDLSLVKAAEQVKRLGELENTLLRKDGSYKQGADPKLIKEYETLKEEYTISQTTLEKITSQIRQAETRRGSFDVTAQKERSKRYAKLMSAIDSKNTVGTEKLIQMLASQKGKFDQPDFKPIEIKQPEVEALMTKLQESPKLDGYEKLQASMVLNDIIGNPKMESVGGRVPTNRELMLLEKVFGKEFVEAVKSHKDKWAEFREQFKDITIDILNIPRAIMASVDMSAPLRQGLVITTTRPRQSIPAFGRMVREFFSDEFYRMMEEKIQNSPNKELYEASGLEFTKSGEQKLSGKEEAFMSTLAEKLPFGIGSLVRASERAYVGYLNDVRAGTFDAIAKNFTEQGITPKNNPKVYEDLAKFINLATGRGKVSAKYREMTPLLNNVFFSIRNNLAKIQLPAMLFDPKLSPEIRKQTAKSLVETTAIITGLLTMAKLAGAEVETDPRSSDFAKIKMGDTRLDLLGGWQQWIRNTAQVITNQQKDLSSGQITGGDKFPFTGRDDRLWRFIRSKFSPAAGIGVDVLSGKTFLGEDVTLQNQLDIVPFAVQDIYEAVQEHGVNGLFLGIPAFFGAGLQTFETKKKLR